MPSSRWSRPSGQAARDQMGVGHRHDAVVLAVHDERGDLDAVQAARAVVHRGGHQLGLVGILVELVVEAAADVLGDAVGVLLAAAAAVVVGHRRPGGLLTRPLVAAVEERHDLLVGRLGAAAAGRRRAEHERADAPGMAQRDLLGDHAAEREPVDVGLRDLERVEHGHGVVGEGFGRVGGREAARAPDAAVVERDHAKAAAQRVHRAPPRPAAQAEAHDEQHRLALAGALPVQLGVQVRVRGAGGGRWAHQSNHRARVSKLASVLPTPRERLADASYLK